MKGYKQVTRNGRRYVISIYTVGKAVIEKSKCRAEGCVMFAAYTLKGKATDECKKYWPVKERSHGTYYQFSHATFAHKFCDNLNATHALGIHFFRTLKEAIEYR